MIRSAPVVYSDVMPTKESDVKRCTLGPIDMINGRMALCNGTFRSNCIGTALYLAGEIGNDFFVDTDTVKGRYLSRLRLIETPVVGCMVAWEESYRKFIPEVALSRLDLDPKLFEERTIVVHMAVVSSLEPFLLAHRDKCRGKFVVGQPFAEVDSGHKRSKSFFYLPRMLDETLRQGGVSLRV